MTPAALPARAVAVVAAAALLLAIGGCAKDATAGSSPAPNPTPSSATVSTAVTTAAAAKPGLTPQGFLSKKIGQMAGLDCPETATSVDACAIKFVVDKIDVNPPCSQYGTPAPTGRKTVVLTVSMTTGNLSTEGANQAPMIFNPFSLQGIAPDGFVHEAKPGTCTETDGRFTNTIIPNGRFTGRVEVEVPESCSAIASSHQAGKDGGRGWVWEIGG